MTGSAANAQNPSIRTLECLQNGDEFIGRHVGPDDADIRAMLAELQLTSLEQLIDMTVPESIALKRPLALGKPATEQQVLSRLKTMVSADKPARSFIGLGYYDTLTPNVIARNVLENPGWYTAYTPYQPEVSQGRLETLLAFQQMILDMTGMDLANASLLDEATAAAEAMAMAKRISQSSSETFFVDQECFPQTIDVIKTRAEAFGFSLIVGDIATLSQHDVFGAIFQYPASNGSASVRTKPPSVFSLDFPRLPTTRFLTKLTHGSNWGSAPGSS